MTNNRKVHACDLGDGRTGWMIRCPACGNGHLFEPGPRPNGGAGWTFNGDHERPTFSPSMLVRSVEYPPFAPGTEDYARGEDGKYLLDDKGRLLGAKDTVCHSFVRDGRIQFLGDCTHELAGETVDLPAW